jgi:hypothetical protein
LQGARALVVEAPEIMRSRGALDPTPQAGVQNEAQGMNKNGSAKGKRVETR